MSKLTKYDLQGSQLGDVEIADQIASAEANGQMIKDYIVALRANARQWSASTKTRAEVSHTTKKPHAQKGGGRARQGSLVAPQYKGGGRVFGPRPKFDQHVRINKKERQAAIRFLLAEKLRESKLHVVQDFNLENPKTRSVTSFLKTVGLEGKRVLFLGEESYVEFESDGVVQRMSVSSDQHDNFVKSMRNIPKASFALVKNISGYDVLVAHHIVLTESALVELQQWLC